MKEKKIRILIAEDNYLVSKDIHRVLNNLGYEVVGDASDGLGAVNMACSLKPDVILMDIEMPELNGLDATARIQDCCPTPVVILSAHDSQDLLSEASEKGASAYLTKPPNSVQIDRSITIAMARHNDLMEMRRINEELNLALSKIKTLSGLLPICASCKKIRDDQGYWNQLEKYIEDHTDADFTHGICPQCSEKLYSDQEWFKKKNN